MGEYHDALSEGGVTAYSMYDAWEDYRCATGFSPCSNHESPHYNQS